jgi:hypothetical protein
VKSHAKSAYLPALTAAFVSDFKGRAIRVLTADLPATAMF